MRGSIFQRTEGKWTIVLDLPRQMDPHSGKMKRVQKWITVRGTKKQAQQQLATMLHNVSQRQVVGPSRMTLGQWLDEWMNSSIKPNKRLRTYETYNSVIKNYLKPELGQYRLSDLRATHLQAYYHKYIADEQRPRDWKTLATATLQAHHAILHSPLQAAVLSDLVPRNAAALVVGKPRGKEKHEDVAHNSWDVDEARKFVDTAKASSPQPAAFGSLALDSGMRKAELCGAQWKDLDIEQRRISIVRQLVKIGPVPIFGPPKNGKARPIDLDERTVELLRKHKASQAAHRLLLGTAYQDHGLIFTRHFGQPLLMNNLGQREYARLIKEAGVKSITFHGLRHTCATLALQAGVPVKVVSERLGHKRIEITLNIYAHCLPSMQQEAAVKLGKLLHG